MGRRITDRAGTQVNDPKRDWATPEEVLAPLKQGHLGKGIVYDPCSNWASNVEAEICCMLPEYETKPRFPERNPGTTVVYGNGLEIQFVSAGQMSVFCNPPYSRQDNKIWTPFLVEEGLRVRDSMHCVYLVHACLETQWFGLFWETASAMAIWKNRLRFVDPDTGVQAKTRADFQSSLVYYGPSVSDFALAYHDRARILTEWV
jgi:hypothetical protein